ncbi:VOC family protein [Membranihabitans marinus]|uniref:VOC family protein n=1 Tax=Membranihabitans marinus TaxID=1227546 RepID=UPI001F2DC679|nr:VOC family protein [Membranihabitans marinus]
MKNAVNWFEIPVKDFDKAKEFYETILGKEMQVMEMAGMKSAFFAADLQNGIGGCIVQSQGYEPSMKGSLIYLNGGEDLSGPLSKVEAAGGEVLLPKTSIGANGFMAHFKDCEGNKVGLHSEK